jgi:hypothetical protein
MSGAKGYWKTRLDSFGSNQDQERADQYELAVTLARVGDNERAFGCLEKSFVGHSDAFLYWLQGEPAFDSMRSDLRFRNLLHRISLPQ